ncbi:MAG: type II toxin-antitoxin system VapC family toxin [Terriglobia bacterium]|jgi:toxin-antitoxin system PIN domain toxin
MTLIDANILLYAYDPSSPHHRTARRWLETTILKPEGTALAWMTLLAFVRISTSPRPLEHPLSTAEAAAIVSGWLERPMFTILNPGERHWDILRSLMTKGQVHGPLIMDAHLAALAIEHGATLATTDRDFTRFPGLRILNPLEL